MSNQSPTSCKVTDTAPALGFEATYMIDTDELNIKRYVQDAISSQTLIHKQTEANRAVTDNLWPALNQAASALITHYPMEKLVEVIMDIVFQAVTADRGALIMLDPMDREQLELKVVRNSVGDQNLQISRTIIEEVMRNQKAVLNNGCPDRRQIRVIQEHPDARNPFHYLRSALE